MLSLIMSEARTFVIVVVSYACIVMLAYVSNPLIYSSQTDALTSASYIIPRISAKNASKVIKQRVEHVREKYESLLKESYGWKMLRYTKNITVETLEPNTTNKWPIYIKTIAHLHASPNNVLNMFNWENLSDTAKKVDPFVESITLLYEPAIDIKVYRRTTAKILLLPKREFEMAMMTSEQRKDFKIPISNRVHSIFPSEINYILVNKNSAVQSHVSVTLNDENRNGYVKSYQDYCAWFVDDGQGGTVIISIMEVDLGADVPRWVFTQSMGALSIWSAQAIAKHAPK